MANFVLVFVLVFAPNGLTDGAIQKSTMERLFHHYEPMLAPNFPVGVGFSMAFLCSYFVANTRILKSVVEERYVWAEDRLSWNAYINVMYLFNTTKLVLPASSIWKPDLKLFNQVQFSERDKETFAMLYINGKVLWFPMAIHYTMCSEEEEIEEEGVVKTITHCAIRIGSWAYNSQEVALSDLNGNFYSLNSYDSENCAKITNVEASKTMREAGKYIYSSVVYKFDIVLREAEVPHVEEFGEGQEDSAANRSFSPGPLGLLLLSFFLHL